MTAFFAPDTNFFLQCCKPEQLSWTDVTDADSIVLVVVKEVQRELDRHKNGGNARKAKRARDVSSQLRQVIKDDAGQLVLRTDQPAVSIRLAPRLAVDRQKPSELDLTIADERIVEEVLACTEHFGARLVLLTNDMVPLQAARDVGLDALPIPDTWLLAPEPNQTEKEIKQLKRQIELLAGSGPAIQVKAKQEGREADRIEGTFSFYPALSNSFIDQAIHAICSAHPMTNEEETPYVSYFGIRKYRGDYERWGHVLREKLEMLPRIFNGFIEPVRTTLVFLNDGFGSADHLVVDIYARGSIRLIEQEKIDQLKKRPVRSLPGPPEFRNEAPLDFILDRNDAQVLGSAPAYPQFPVPPASREFFWRHDDPRVSSQHCQGECIDFRHGLGPHTKTLLLRNELETSHDVAGALEIRISAKNIALPIDTILPVRLKCEMRNTEQRAAETIEQELGVHL